jgi:hypothetical protein
LPACNNFIDKEPALNTSLEPSVFQTQINAQIKAQNAKKVNQIV